MSRKLSKRGDPEQLVTRTDLEALLADIKGLEPYRPYMEKRWIGMVMWWHERSIEAKRRYFLLRALVVAGGVSIPVLTTLSLLEGWQTPTAVAIAIVGAVVAGAAAWEGIANYGETWREKRRASELLKVEGWQFIQLCGKYEPQDSAADAATSYQRAYPRFAAEVEAMVAREVGEHLAMFDPSLEQAKNASADMIDTIVEESLRRLKTGQKVVP